MAEYDLHYDVGEKGTFEILSDEIEALLPAEGGWWIDDDGLVVHTTVSRDVRRNTTGGEYDFYTHFRPVGDGILVYQGTSCILPQRGFGEEYGLLIPCIVSLDGLRRVASLIGLRAACKEFLSRGIGFAELREAVKLAE